MQEQDIKSVHQYREVPSWTVEEIRVGGIWQSLVTNYKAWPDLLWQAELHSNTWWLMWYITVQTDVGMQYSRLAINMNMCKIVEFFLRVLANLSLLILLTFSVSQVLSSREGPKQVLSV